MSRNISRPATPDHQGLVADGWAPIDGGEFMSLVGPLWRRVVDGRPEYGFLPDRRHANHRDIVHGGMIMTFADFVVGMAGAEATGNFHQVTIQLDVQFVAAAVIGELLIGRSEVVRATSSVVFLRGTIEARGSVVAIGSGIWKLVRPRGPAADTLRTQETTK